MHRSSNSRMRLPERSNVFRTTCSRAGMHSQWPTPKSFNDWNVCLTPYSPKESLTKQREAFCWSCPIIQKRCWQLRATQKRTATLQQTQIVSSAITTLLFHGNGNTQQVRQKRQGEHTGINILLILQRKLEAWSKFYDIPFSSCLLG